MQCLNQVDVHRKMGLVKQVEYQVAKEAVALQRRAVKLQQYTEPIWAL